MTLASSKQINGLPARLIAASAGAGIQVLVILLVSLMWRYSAGWWGHRAWAAYFVAFCIITPALGLMVARRIYAWDATTSQLVKTVAVLGLCNGLFAISTPGFGEAGVPLAVYVSAYGVLLFAIVAGLARRW